MAKAKEEQKETSGFCDGWFLFTSSRNQKKILIHVDDMFMLHEGEKPGTMTIEFAPMLDRVVETVNCDFAAFLAENVTHMDVDEDQKEGPVLRGPKLVLAGSV